MRCERNCELQRRTPGRFLINTGRRIKSFHVIATDTQPARETEEGAPAYRNACPVLAKSVAHRARDTKYAQPAYLTCELDFTIHALRGVVVVNLETDINGEPPEFLQWNRTSKEFPLVRVAVDQRGIGRVVCTEKDPTRRSNAEQER